MTTSSIALVIGDIHVRQHNGLYSLNDLHRASGGSARHQPAKFSCLEQTRALIAELNNSPESESFRTVQGRNGGTYACKELVIAYAAWINAAFHLKVIRVFLAEQPSYSRQAEQLLSHTIDRLASQLEQPNSYPVEMFIPLYEVIRRRLGRSALLTMGARELADLIQGPEGSVVTPRELAGLAAVCTTRLADLVGERRLMRA